MKSYTQPLAGHFYRLVLDEGHKVKNPKTKTAHAAKLVRAKHTLIVTATPMINRVNDLAGYLDLLFRDEWRLAGAEADEQAYGPAFDPYDDATLPRHTPLYQHGGALAIWQDAAQTTPVAAPPALWRLDPHLFRTAMRGLEADTEAFKATKAHRILRSILPLIQLRRTMATEIVSFPGASAIRIGDGIPHFRICTVELGFTSAQQRRYDRLHDIGIRKLFTGVVENSRELPSQNDAAGGRSIAVHRQLSHAVFNLDLDTLAKRRPKNLVKDVNRWYDKTADRGMSFYWEHVKPVPSLPPYADRFSFGVALAENSPKLKYLSGVLLDSCLGDERERVLIMCGWPMTQWNCEGFIAVSHSHVVARQPEPGSC